jgi:ATP-binding cassette subfamily A (ABC1) protein 3
MGTIQEFPRLFDFIDSNKGKLQIQSYGISITTLEEVFLRVANLKDDKPLAM